MTGFIVCCGTCEQYERPQPTLHDAIDLMQKAHCEHHVWLQVRNCLNSTYGVAVSTERGRQHDREAG